MRVIGWVKECFIVEESMEKSTNIITSGVAELGQCSLSVSVW